MVTLEYQNTTASSHPHQKPPQSDHHHQENNMSEATGASVDKDKTSPPPKSAVSTRSIDVNLKEQKSIDNDLAKKALKLNLVSTSDLDEDLSIKSPKSPSSVRIQHQTSITSQVDLGEDRKTLRDALYQGIFHRHRRTIFAVGSFLRMLRSRNSQYNTIRSSSEGEDVDEEVR